MKNKTKNTSKKRRIIKAVISVIIVIGVIFSAYFTLNIFAMSKYCKTPAREDLSGICDISKTDRDKAIKAIAEDDMKIAKAIELNGSDELSGEQQEEIDKLNEKITDFFVETQSFDVSDRLDDLEVKVFDFAAAGYEGVCGYFNNFTWENRVYLDAFEMMPTMRETAAAETEEANSFHSTYIHEALHYLGFAPKGNYDMVYLYEGIAEYLTSTICEEKAIDYEFPAYEYYTPVARNILQCFPQMIKEFLTAAGDYELSKKLNEDYPGFATQIENAMLCGDNENGEPIKMFEIEYLAGEYCKRHDSMPQIMSDNFGIKWLFAK